MMQQQNISKVSYECEICKDTMWVECEPKEEGYQNANRRCECYYKYLLNNAMKTCNITDEIQNKSFANFQTENIDEKLIDIKKECEEYTRGLINYYKQNKTLKETPSLVICGKSGMGKTHLITAIARELIKQAELIPYFFNWVSSFKEWYGYYTTGDTDKVNEIRERLLNTELLIIDDLCKDNAIKENWINEFYSIVDYRYRKKLPIVISTEYNTELISMLSEATFGRIFEMTENKKQNKFYFFRCFPKDNESPIKYNYRLRGLQ